MSAVKLYEQLLASGIIEATGKTYFELHGIKTIVQDHSVVGNIIQEWLAAFMEQHHIHHTQPDNTQEFPDYFVAESNGDHGLLEVKCFKDSPNFDVANFMAYCRSLTVNPHRLDAQYLIVKYAPLDDGVVIKNIWLKKFGKLPAHPNALHSKFNGSKINPTTFVQRLGILHAQLISPLPIEKSLCWHSKKFSIPLLLVVIGGKIGSK